MMPKRFAKWTLVKRGLLLEKDYQLGSTLSSFAHLRNNHLSLLVHQQWKWSLGIFTWTNVMPKNGYWQLEKLHHDHWKIFRSCKWVPDISFTTRPLISVFWMPITTISFYLLPAFQMYWDCSTLTIVSHLAEIRLKV